MRIPWCGLFLGLGLAVASTATAKRVRADDLQSTRFALRETRHVATVTLDRGFARIVVQRAVENDGAKSDQATYFLGAMGDGAVAVGLRTLGYSPAGAPTWFAGELMEAEAAAAKYKELTGIGGYTPKDPALLSWRSSSLLALQVFPVPAKSEKVVEVTWLAPMTYADGAYAFSLPAADPDGSALPPSVLVRAARASDRAFVNGVPASGAVSGREALSLSLRPGGARPVEGALASIGVGKDRFVTHASLRMARRISDAPAFAAVAVVIDASRSEKDVLANEAALARAYLGHMKDATVDLFTFDREVHRLSPHPLPVAEAIALLYKPITSANGSRIDAAIARADAALAARPATHKRMLVLSDLMVRHALSPAVLGLRKLASGALMHVASVSDGPAALERDDDSAWARVPAATGGVLWRASHSDRVDAASRARMEELARPLHVDAVELRGLAGPFDEFPAMGGQLSEGQGLERWAIDGTAPSELAVDGLLWSTPVQFRFGPDAGETKRAAALVFGTSLLSELTEPEMSTLAWKGGAVSPVTSYLAIEPGVRPSTEGLEEGVGLGGVGSGHGAVVRSGATSIHRRPDLDRDAFLRAAIATRAKACGARGDVHVEIETTAAEIVEVASVAQTERRDASVEACLREAVWSIELPDAFEDAWMIYTLDVSSA